MDWIFFAGSISLICKVAGAQLLVGLMTLGLVLTAVGTYVIAATVGGPKTYFFQDYFSPTMILAVGNAISTLKHN